MLHGHSGQDLMLGGAGHDILFGGRDNDILRGGPGGDVLYGQTGNDILLGGAGNDRLYDSYHFNLLIGGDGRDRLSTRRGQQSAHGGNGLLIGSSTIYDGEDDDSANKEDSAHHAALLAILAEWSSGRVLAERVSNIWGGLGLAAGFPLSPRGEIVDDQTTDYLLGGGDPDFFFQLGDVDMVFDPQPNDHVESK